MAEPPEMTRSGLLKMSQGMGLLAKELYAVFTTPVGDGKAMGPLIEAHLAYQADLEARGVMFGAGPLYHEGQDDWNGEGMIIIRAASDEDARQIAEADPMHSGGGRSFTIRPWLMNEGTVTVKINYAAGTRELI